MFSITFFGGNRRWVPLLIDGSTVLGLVLSDVILVASRSLLFKENNVAVRLRHFGVYCLTHPRPAPSHAVTTSYLEIELGAPFGKGRGGPGGWWIKFEPELHLGDDILVPGLAGWRRERMPELPDTAYFTLAPDWVCKVLSASTRRLDLHGKRPVYAREGVAHLWLVDPTDRTLEAFELRAGEWVLIGTAKDDEPVSVRPFDAITLSLGDLWP